MSILIISGSRDRKGKTAQAVDAFSRGVAKAGGKSDSIFLPEQKIERCRQCNPDGWGICRSEGVCVIQDDFASIVSRIEAADSVIFTNPVYFGDLCDSLRAFLDRYRRIRFSTFFRPPGAGGPPMGMGMGGKPAIGYCYAGGSGMGTVTALASLERELQTAGFDLVDMIPARRQNLEQKLPILEKTGEWLVSKPTSGPWPPPPPAKETSTRQTG